MSYFMRQTKRIEVRPLMIKDYDAWLEYYSSMHSKRNIWDRENRISSELKKEKFKKIIKSQLDLRKKDQFYDLAVFERFSGQLIGAVSAMDVLRGLAQTAYLGYFIHNNFWGKGYGKEAVLELIDIAFRDIKLHRIEAGIEPNNRRSIMLARSIGLRKEGLKKRAVFIRGEWRDLVMYSATCEEFGISWEGAPKTRPR